MSEKPQLGPDLEKNLPIENLEDTKELNPREKLERVLELTRKLYVAIMDWRDGIEGTEDYTLIGEKIGVNRIENSSMASRQLLFAMALSQSPLVENLVKSWEELQTGELYTNNRLGKETMKEEFEKMTKEKPLKGLRILDLGCGRQPTFPRIVRALGADVYTVDQISADAFKYYDDQERTAKIRKGIIKKEKQNHIQIDLRSKNVIEILKDKTGGEFDLTTEAHLTSDDFRGGWKIGLALLKKGGFHYDPTDYTDGEPDRVVHIKD